LPRGFELGGAGREADVGVGADVGGVVVVAVGLDEGVEGPIEVDGVVERVAVLIDEDAAAARLGDAVGGFVGGDIKGAARLGLEGADLELERRAGSS
jgi:hypothetical protein